MRELFSSIGKMILKKVQLAKDINYLLAIWMESLVKKRGEMASQLQSLMQKSEHESPPD